MSSPFNYSFNANKISVSVYKKSILDVIGIDAIVNPANDDLNLYRSNLAYEISKKAGPSLDEECSNHLKKNGKVTVGNNIVTRPGHMIHLKGIIHAVRPRWKSYTDKKKFAYDLHETVVHILQTANENKFPKIALPEISSGLHDGAPISTCADEFVRAVIDYSRDANPNCVTEVHFVDINEDVLKEIKKAHERMKFRVLEHADDQGGVKPRQGAKFFMSVGGVAGHSSSPSAGTDHLSCEVHYITKEPMKHGVSQNIFKAGSSSVRIYSGSIVKVMDADALVCTVGSDLKGHTLAQVFESTMGISFKQAISKLGIPYPAIGEVVFLTETVSLKPKYVLLAIMESKRITTMDAMTTKKLKDMYVRILERANEFKIKKIALTLIGSGLLVSDANQLECCCNSLFDGLTSSQAVRGIYVEDIQVVNMDKKVTDAIVRVFHKRSSGHQAKQNINGSIEGKLNSSEMQNPKENEKLMSPRFPNVYKDLGGKKIGKSASMYVRSSPKIAHGKDDDHNGAQGFGNLGKDRKEVTKKERIYHSSLLSQDEEDISHVDQRPNGNQPMAGNGEYWLRMQNSRTAGNLNMYDVKGGILITVSKSKIGKSGETCSAEDCEKAAKRALGCGHKFCDMCFVPMQSNFVCTICSQKSYEITLGTSSADLGKPTNMLEAPTSSDTCIICMEKLDTRYKLKCGHDSFHEKCIMDAFMYKEVCPLCGKVLGIVTGNQPYGKMNHTIRKTPLSGYDGCGLIEILYEFHDGIQSADHPHPHKRYQGTRRKAYLPDNKEGQTVLKMLNVAFERKLVFTIGESRTTGLTDRVTWNDIHHKTKMEGGPSNYGYPDPGYLKRVKEELEAKGITEADI